MKKPFLHHCYVNLPPHDVSGNGNNGLPHDLTVGAGTLGGTAGFNGRTSWIEVPRSTSMDNLGLFQGRVVFKLDPAAPAHRLNLVEGFVSFAIVINADRSVSFTIVDRQGLWRGCTSVPGLVSTGVWHTVVAAHDGISEARIGLDAEVVARATDILGPVRSVGALGIAIGRWPDAPAYQFQGYVSEVALYKFDPIPDLNIVLGAPCVDQETITALLRRMVERIGEDGVFQWAHALQDLLQQVAGEIQANEADTDKHRKRIASVVLAIGGRDMKAFEEAFDAYREPASKTLHKKQYAEFQTRFADLMRQMPLSDDERRDLVRALCFDRLVETRKEQGL